VSVIEQIRGRSLPSLGVDSTLETALPQTHRELLVVDDELATRILLSQIFEQMGYTVRTAADGFSALALIRESAPDILLSDLNMPGMSGFELLSVVRRRFPAVYVIATSGAYSGLNVPRGIAADSYYEKATGFRFLLSLMEEAIAERGPRALLESAAEPMWVPEIASNKFEEAKVLIHCPECLRGFAHACDGLRSDGFEFRETECEHCKCIIYYAIVQQLDPATAQPYHRAVIDALREDLPPEILEKVEAELAHGIELVKKRHA
jgi:CheY-like chemotaxis protein